MSPADQHTGSPPAVTFEQLERWREIAAAIDSALNMGGELGMDLLVSRIAEWNEAVDEWTTALQTCLELGSRGLRDEAAQWHAEGFLDAGDSLHAPTQRDGWQDWLAALEERQIPTPQFDTKLRKGVSSLAEELRARDMAGRSIQGQLDCLRRNVLVRGDLGERLTLLDSIRSLDPGREAWTDMIAPIRRQRAEQLEAEIRIALGAGDFRKLARLVEEGKTVDWEGQLAAPVEALLNATDHLLRSRDVLHALEESAAQLSMRTRELKDQPINLPSFPAMLRATLQARKAYLGIRQELSHALQQAVSVPETKAVVGALSLLTQGRQVDASVKSVLAWVGQQEQFEKLRLQFCKLEVEIQKTIDRAPQQSGTWEEFKRDAARWLQAVGDLRIDANSLCADSPDFVPASTVARLSELDACRTRIKADRDRVVYREKVVIGSVIGGLLLVVLVIIIVVVMAANSSPR